MSLIIVDPQAKGTVNVISPRPLGNDVLYAPVTPAAAWLGIKKSRASPGFFVSSSAGLRPGCLTDKRPPGSFPRQYVPRKRSRIGSCQCVWESVGCPVVSVHPSGTVVT